MQHLYVNQKIIGSEMFLMEDDLESSSSMEIQRMTDLTKFYHTIEFILKTSGNIGQFKLKCHP